MKDAQHLKDVQHPKGAQHLKDHPSLRTLVIVWLALMGATGLTMIAGNVTDISSIGWLWATGLMAITWLKARLILAYFLNLKAATSGWNTIFTVLISMVIFAIYALYAAGEASL